MYPRSIYMPFDLLGISSDTRTITRYRIGYERVQYTQYADEFILYEANIDEPRFLLPDDVNDCEYL